MNASRAMRLLLAAVLALGATPAVAVDWTPVIRAGDPAPGLPGQYLNSVTLISVGSESLVFEGGGYTPQYLRAIYRWTAATGVELVTSLEASTVTADGVVLDVWREAMAIGGNELIVVNRPVELAACPEFLENEAYRDASFVIDVNGASVPMVAPGTPVPGRPGWIFMSSGFCCNGSGRLPRIDDQGGLAYFARVQQRSACDSNSSAPRVEALFVSNAAGEKTLIAFPGDPVPGGVPGSTLTPDLPVEMNATGQVAFRGRISNGAGGEPYAAIFRWTPAMGLRVVASGKDFEVPQLGWTFEIGDGGHVAYTLGGALFVVDSGGGLTNEMTPGDTTPGLPGFEFLSLTTPPYASSRSDFVVNGLGDVAFSAWAWRPGVIEPTRWGLWSPDGSGALVLRLVDGQPAPHLDGVTISRVQQFRSVLAMNDQLEVLVQVEVDGPYPVETDARAYYLIDAVGNIQLLARSTPQPFEFGPGDVRPAAVRGLYFDAGLRHVAFEGDSFQGSWIHAIFHGAVPEPDAISLAIAALASLGALSTLRRRP